MNRENVIIKNNVVCMSLEDFLAMENEIISLKDSIKLLKNKLNIFQTKRYLSINKFAKKYGLCRATVYNHIKEGKVEFIRVGDKYRVLG